MQTQQQQILINKVCKFISLFINYWILSVVSNDNIKYRVTEQGYEVTHKGKTLTAR